MVVSAVLGLWFSRDTTFSVDEFRIFLSSPHLDLRGAIEPLNGHLILTTRLVYAAILDVFGPDYLSFRLLATGAVLLTAGLFFEFAQRRIGAVAALAPTLVLLLYGSDAYHVIVGNAFTVLLPLAAGLGALLALEREDLGGDIGACLLLCLAVATYSVGLAFLAGAAVLILIGSDRWRRAWVFLVPALIYAAWLVWSSTATSDVVGSTTTSQVQISNLLLVPSWAFNALATVGSALLGLDYNYSESGSGLPTLDTSWGPVVAVVAIAALGWRLWRGDVSKWLWAVMAIPAALWVIGAAAALPPIRVPQKSEYVFPGTIAVLLVAVEAARGLRFGRGTTIVLYGAAAIGPDDQHRMAARQLGAAAFDGHRDADRPRRGRDQRRSSGAGSRRPGGAAELHRRERRLNGVHAGREAVRLPGILAAGAARAAGACSGAG